MNDVQAQLRAIFDEYGEQVRDVANEAFRKVSRETVRKLKATSPKDDGRYASGWKVEQGKAHGDIISVTVYNAKMPGLTQLLEKGHIVRNQYGEYGRVAGRSHIKPVEEEETEELVSQIERNL